MSFRIAVIGGTGMEEGFKNLRHNPQTSRFLSSDRFQDQPVSYTEVYEPVPFLFVDRHHALGAYRFAPQLDPLPVFEELRRRGVRYVIGTTAVGVAPAFVRTYPIGAVVAPDDFFAPMLPAYTLAVPGDQHQARYFRSPVDLFCPEMRRACVNLSMRYGGVLGNIVRGNRFESTAEVAFGEQNGVAFFGMPTALPEAILARECSMHYLCLAIVTNVAGDGQGGHDVDRALKDSARCVRERVLQIIESLSHRKPTSCPCESRAE